MAPLTVGAAIFITHKFYDAQIKRNAPFIAGSSPTNGSGTDSNTAPPVREAWLFAPVLMFMSIAVSILWYLYFDSNADSGYLLTFWTGSRVSRGA